MRIRFTVGHLGAGEEDLEVPLEQAKDTLDSLLRELHTSDDEHYQVYVFNSIGASLTVFDGGLMVLHSVEKGDEHFFQPTTQAEAVSVLLAFVLLKNDVLLPNFTPDKPEPGPGPNYILAEMGEFALHKAAASGNLTRVQALVETGTEVNRPDQYGATPLMLAAIEGHEGVCQFLLEHGADATVRDPEDGSGLLRLARQHPRLVEILKRAGAVE